MTGSGGIVRCILCDAPEVAEIQMGSPRGGLLGLPSYAFRRLTCQKVAVLIGPQSPGAYQA